MNQTTVTVVGLGRIGLPTLIAIAKTKKYKTFGLDTDTDRVHAIDRDSSLLRYQSLVTNDPDICLPFSDIIIFCVPTLLTTKNNPDIHHVIEATTTLLRSRKKKFHLIIESTLPPGICTKKIMPLFLKNGLRPGSDFELSYCPERLNPGDTSWPLRRIPRIIASITPQGQKQAIAFYRSFIKATIYPMTSIEETVMAKLVENVFRDVNIAFVNELATICNKNNLDIIRILAAAKTKPFSFLPHEPGIGVGGACIPTAAYYLKSLNNDRVPALMKSARRVNDTMPAHTLRLLHEALAEIGQPLSTLTVGILGMSYKANSDDIRRSPSFDIINELRHETQPELYDPFVPYHSTVLTFAELLRKSDILIIATAHSECVQSMKGLTLHRNGIRIVIDGRNCLNEQDIRRFGIIYKGIGR